MGRVFFSARSLCIIVGILLLAACVARERIILRLERRGIEFPSNWTTIERSFLWKPPRYVWINDHVSVKTAWRLRWVSGFQEIEVSSHAKFEPDFFRELGTQNRVHTFTSDSAITDELLASFDVFPNLKTLYLEHRPLTCEKLPMLKQLEKLGLQGPLSETGIARVASLPNLKYLNINNSALNKDGVMRLLSTPRLEELYVTGCLSITRDECKSLEAAYPHVKFQLEFVPGTAIEDYYRSL